MGDSSGPQRIESSQVKREQQGGDNSSLAWDLLPSRSLTSKSQTTRNKGHQMGQQRCTAHRLPALVSGSESELSSIHKGDMVEKKQTKFFSNNLLLPVHLSEDWKKHT